jgi:membrane protease YdiL (CAAX protease family)
MEQFIISLFLVLAGVAVFVFGSPYYTNFPTNSNQTYYLALSAVFLVLTLVFKNIPSLARFWPTAFAFLMASAGLVFLKTGVLNLPRDPANPLRFMALDKLSQFLHIVPVIIGLTLLVGDDLGSIFIKLGSLRQGLIFGLVSFVVFAVLGILIGKGAPEFFPSLLKAAPWILLFVFTNAIMEELWFRAIFLQKFDPLVGQTAAILITGLIFGLSHINATYDFPGGGFVFGLVVFTLGVVGAYVMFKHDSLIGPVLFHAGYDLLILVPVLNSIS